MSSSKPSLLCRIDWRPSRALSGALCLLGGLAGYSLWLSALPRWPAALAGLACLAYGVISGWRLQQQTCARLVWPGSGEPALIEGAGKSLRLTEVSLHLRGPMAVLSGRDADGHRQRWQWYPDTLCSDDRRALRLAASRKP